MHRCLAILCIGLLLSGCSNLSFSGVSSSAAAGAGALGAAVVTSNPVVIATTAAVAGVATDAVVPEPEVDPVVETLWEVLWRTARELIHWIVGATVLLTLAAWLIPGPQFTWRKKDGRTNSTDHRSGSGWRNS